MRRFKRYAVGVATLVCGAVSDAHGDPFLVRNRHPVVALYGLPSPLPARLSAVGTTQLAGVVNWSSFANRFAVHGELAYRHLSEGPLDSAVDTWHRIFGLPDVVFNIAARRGF